MEVWESIMELGSGKDKKAQNNKRIGYIDTLRGLAMILVLVGHNDTSLTKYIYSFHMPLFFFISGLVYKNDNSDFKEFVKKRFKGLMIPYFSLALLLYFLWMPLMHTQEIVLYRENMIRNFIGIFYSQGSVNMAWGLQLWFLPCLFVTSIIFYFISKIKKKFFMIISIILVSSIGFFINSTLRVDLLWSFDIALVGVLFYGSGFLLKDKLGNYKFKVKDSICVCVGFTFFLLLNKVNGRVDMYSGNYNNIILFIANSLLGIYMVVAISKSIHCGKIINFIGTNTIIILAFHIRALSLIKSIYLMIFSLPLKTTSIFNGVILIPIFEVILIIPIIFLLKQIKEYVRYKSIKKIKEEQVILVE